MFKYIVAWLPLLVIAVLNGALRAGLYGPYLGELRGHQVSTALGVILFGVYIRALMDYWRPESSRQALYIGLVWLGMTVAFEFLFMHYVAGYPWRALLHDYNIFAGRVWLVLLLWLTIAPYVFYRLQKRRLH